MDNNEEDEDAKEAEAEASRKRSRKEITPQHLDPNLDSQDKYASKHTWKGMTEILRL